jgi:phosphoribosylformylglycinamidine (FGAM) synthase-like enzyme
VRELVRDGLAAAKDVSDGGLAVAAAEMSGGRVGADLEFPAGVAPVRALFGEWHGRFLLAAAPAAAPAVERVCAGLPLARLGVAGGGTLGIRCGTRVWLDEPVAALEEMRDAGLAFLGES